MWFLALCSSVFAYDFAGSDWSWMDRPLATPVYLDLDQFPEDFADADLLEDNIIRGLESWNGLANLELVYGGTEPDAAAYEAAIVIGYTDVTSSLVLAANFQYGSAIGADRCDIFVMGGTDTFRHNWVFEDGVMGRHLSETIAHEIGHCLGLGHSTDADAVMYAGQTNHAEPSLQVADDVAGIRALYPGLFWGDCHDDLDGDGVLDCEGDCADDDPLVGPGFAELCDGVDNDCDGVVDEITTDLGLYGVDAHRQTRTGAFFNAYVATEAVTLEQFAVLGHLTEPALASWMVYELAPGQGPQLIAAPTQLVAPEADGWMTSPLLNIDLMPGSTYWVGFATDREASIARGARPEGQVHRGLEVTGHGLDTWDVDRFDPDFNIWPDYAYRQQLTFSATPDGDADGIADACDTCMPGGPDTDGDGLPDCDDACPNEAGNPDGDGVCAQQDVCPEHYDPSQIDTDGDGLGNACDPTPAGTSGGNGSSSSGDDSDAGGCSLFGMLPMGGLLSLFGFAGGVARRPLL